MRERGEERRGEGGCVVGGSCCGLQEGSRELGRRLWRGKVQSRALRHFAGLSLWTGTRCPFRISIFRSERRTVTGSAERRALLHRTGCHRAMSAKGSCFLAVLCGLATSGETPNPGVDREDYSGWWWRASHGVTRFLLVVTRCVLILCLCNI